MNENCFSKGFSKEMLIQLLNDVPNILVLLNSKGEVVAYNKNINQLLGNEGNLKGKNWIKEFVEIEFQSQTESLLKDMIFAYEKYGYAENFVEYSVQTTSGIKKISWDKTVLQDPKTKELLIILFGEDVSLKQLIEEGYLESEIKYRALFENINDSVFHVDEKWFFTDLNKSGISFFNLKEEIVRNFKLLDFFLNPEDVIFFKKIIQKHKFITDYEVYLTDYNGKVLYVIISCNVVEGKKGEVKGYQGIIKDYTEKFKREEKLRLLQQAINYSSGIVIITDEHGIIEHINPIFSKITGYLEKDIIGKSMSILNSGEHDVDFFKNLWMTINQGKTWVGEILDKKKNGELFNFKCGISPVFGKDGLIEHFICVGNDVTKEKLLEKQVNQAMKMETVGRLAGGIAHDFNNLLTIINGYADMLIDLSGNDAIKEDLVEIKNAGIKAANLTRQILAFSRKQKSKPKNVELNTSINELNKMLGRLVGENIKLKLNLCKEKLFLKIDPVQLEQIIMNLVVNARDAMKRGGVITIETSNAFLNDDNFIERNEIVLGEYVLMKVSDTGTGIPKDIIDNVFEPFFTTKEKGQGTGLGLSTVYGIVKQNAGCINIESEVGVGTTFFVYFLKVDQLVEENETSELFLKEKLLGKTVLIVEDDVQVKKIAEIIFKDIGFNVISASCAEKANEINKKYIDKIDLLFCDLILPTTTGDKLAEKLKKMNKNVHCLFVSGYPEEQLKNSGIKTEQLVIVEKPYYKEDIIKEIIKIF